MFPAPDPFTPEQTEFYSILGWSISKWQVVEDELGEVYAILVAGGGNTFAAKAAFHAMGSFKPQLDMANWAAQATLRASPLLATWDKLNTKLRRLSDRRNELAHNSVVETAPPREGWIYHSSSAEFCRCKGVPAPWGGTAISQRTANQRSWLCVQNARRTPYKFPWRL